jgi:hypothetical protein
MPIYLTDYDLAKLDRFQLWQLDRYGNILAPASATDADESFEAGIEEIDRLSEWTEQQAQIDQLIHEQ